MLQDGPNPSATPLGRNWRDALAGLLGRANESVAITSPYVTAVGVGFIEAHLAPSFRSRGALTFVTDLSPMSVAQGSVELEAVGRLRGLCARLDLRHLARVHSKVYVADASAAIVTSGNLTQGGLYANFEYGVGLTAPEVVREIRADVLDYAALGAAVGPETLAAYAAEVESVRTLYRRSAEELDAALREAVGRATTALVQGYVAGGPIHTVFERTVLYVLRREGPLTTRELHGHIQALHPDLCDDTVDRVIGGQRFGKRWKHAVRTVQQHLKRDGLIRLDADQWSAVVQP